MIVRMSIDDIARTQWTTRRYDAFWSVIEQLGGNKYWFGPMRGCEVKPFIAQRRSILAGIARRRLKNRELAD
jgi:hypothetical protein